MIVKTFKDLIKSDVPAEKEFYISNAENVMNIEVTGEGTFTIEVSGQMESNDTFSRIAAIGLSDYSIAETITGPGMYMFGVAALTKIKVAITEITAENVTISCRTFDDSR